MIKYKAYSFNIVVLIFIFVIVVAIGTVNAVDRIKQHTAKTNFSGLYSKYSNALMSTVAEMYGETGCYFSSASGANFSHCNEFYKTFLKHLNVKKYCQTKALENGCIPEYEVYSQKPSCIGFSRYMMNYEDDAFVMENGSNIIIPHAKDGNRIPMFAVDSNGLAKPNKAGEDLFSMVIIRNASGSYYFHSNITYCLPVEKGGIEHIQDIYK